MLPHTIMVIVPNVGVVELFILLFGLAALALPIWGIIDAAQRPDWQWKAAGASRTTWIALMAIFGFVCSPVGLIVSIYYLAAMRPRLTGKPGYPPSGVVDRDLDR